MPTFQQVHEQLMEARQRAEVLQHLIEYMDENFLPRAGGSPKMTLLEETTRQPVPQPVLEGVITQVLEAKLQEEKATIERILNTPVRERTSNGTKGTSPQVVPGPQGAGAGSPEGDAPAGGRS